MEDSEVNSSVPFLFNCFSRRQPRFLFSFSVVVFVLYEEHHRFRFFSLGNGDALFVIGAFGVLGFHSVFLRFLSEIDGVEEGLRRYHPEHGEGGGGAYHGVGAESHALSAGTCFH